MSYAADSAHALYPHSFHTLSSPAPPAPSSSAPATLRRCSVKNCSRVLADVYKGKMCDVCRGRHRIYASTKRQKRKDEKMALGLQASGIVDGPAVFMPPDPSPPTMAPEPSLALQVPDVSAMTGLVPPPVEVSTVDHVRLLSIQRRGRCRF